MTCREFVREYISDKQSAEDKTAIVEEREAVDVHDFGDDRWRAEGYMGSVVWESLSEAIVAAREGMTFIRQIAKSCALNNVAMQWENQVGFKIKQSIYELDSFNVNTVMFGRIQFVVSTETKKISSRKMQSSSAPNFIHGCDSSHLALSVCNLLDKGITDIWVIHDSFAVHSGWTGHLHKALRREMVDMYKGKNTLLDLLHQVQDNGGVDFELEDKVPKMGELDLDEILKSKYAFS